MGIALIYRFVCFLIHIFPCVVFATLYYLVSRWGVDYVVITSVDRDDLADGGASHFAQTVSLAKFMKPDLKVVLDDLERERICMS